MKIKLKLKTVQQLMSAGASFRINQALKTDDDTIDVLGKDIYKLGNTIEVSKSFSDESLYYDKDRSAWCDAEIENVIEEENQPALKEYSLKDDFRFFLSDAGSLFIGLKYSEHLDYLIKDEDYREIKLSE